MAVMAPWREDDALCSEENLSRHNASYLAGLVSTPTCGKSDKLFMPVYRKYTSTATRGQVMRQ